MSKKLLFSTEGYAYLAPRLVAAAAFDVGSIERKRFPDGERYMRILDDTRGRDVVLLGGTPTDSDTLEVYDLGCAISRAGARSLTLVVPYFGYSTMERAVLSGEVVTAKTRARLISAIPTCEGGTRIVLFDLHTDGIPYYFSDAHVTHHVYGAPLITSTVRAMMGDTPYVLGATDAGRAKWVESLAGDLGVEPAFVYKRRDPVSGATNVTGVNAEVKGHAVVLYDDMIRTGSSLVQAGRVYLNAGATSVHAIASHLVLPAGALDRILASGVFASITGTDSHPGSVQVEACGERGRIASIAGLLAAALDRML